MEDKILINDIVSQCRKHFEDTCYTKCRIARYKEYWRKGIIPFLQKHGSEFLTDQLAQAYLETCSHYGSVRHQECEMIRRVQVLVNYGIAERSVVAVIRRQSVNLPVRLAKPWKSS